MFEWCELVVLSGLGSRHGLNIGLKVVGDAVLEVDLVVAENSLAGLSPELLLREAGRGDGRREELRRRWGNGVEHDALDKAARRDLAVTARTPCNVKVHCSSLGGLQLRERNLLVVISHPPDLRCNLRSDLRTGDRL